MSICGSKSQPDLRFTGSFIIMLIRKANWLLAPAVWFCWKDMNFLIHLLAWKVISLFIKKSNYVKRKTKWAFFWCSWSSNDLSCFVLKHLYSLCFFTFFLFISLPPVICFGKWSSVMLSAHNQKLNMENNRHGTERRTCWEIKQLQGYTSAMKTDGEGRRRRRRWCWVWDSKQVHLRAEGWLVKPRLPILTSPPPPLPFISSVLPASMSPLGSLMDADSNDCPPSPSPSPPPIHPTAPSPPFLLSPSLCPLIGLTTVTSLWKFAILRLNSELLGGQDVWAWLSKAHPGRDPPHSRDYDSLVDGCVSAAGQSLRVS